MANNRIECYHDVDKFLATLKKHDVSENPFLSYAFLSVYLKHFPKGNFYFFNIYEEDLLIAIVPFECTFESGLLSIKKFRFIGYRQFNYEQYICRDNDMDKVHQIFMMYLESQNYSVVLNVYDINSASPLYSILDNETRLNKKIALYSCPCLHFTKSFDDFFKTIYSSSKKRSELKKFQKKVSELGEFKILNIEDLESYAKYQQYLNQIYKVHTERFAGVYATSFFGSERMRPYYSELIRSLMHDSKGHISLLILDDVVIAFIFCLTNGKVLIDWIPAFDPAFARYSLGIVQYKMLFEDICNQGKYELFDYSKGSSVYKRKWAKEETLNYQFIMNLSKYNPIASFVYLIDKYKFSFKVYLREKGVLSFVKHKLGEILAWKNKGTQKKANLKVTNIENYEGTDYKFNYATINNFPVETREAVLSALYQGKRVVSVNETEVIISK